ncbi:MAG: hypothetical protein WCJ87_03490 [Burkholderiales bacterium]
MTPKFLASLKKAQHRVVKEIAGLASRRGAKSMGLIEHPFSRVSILMPKNHRLAEYKKRHRLYDQFLPHLARYLPTGGVVVDIGANVGDTLAAM